MIDTYEASSVLSTCRGWRLYADLQFRLARHYFLGTDKLWDQMYEVLYMVIPLLIAAGNSFPFGVFSVLNSNFHLMILPRQKIL
jgi:hypothetical protein